MSRMEPALEQTFHYFGVPFGGSWEEIAEEAAMIRKLVKEQELGAKVRKWELAKGEEREHFDAIRKEAELAICHAQQRLRAERAEDKKKRLENQ